MGRAAFCKLARLMAMAAGFRAGEKGKSVRFEPYAESRPLQGQRRT